jgi:hypothetical protein
MVCQGASCFLQCGNTFLKQTSFLNHDLCNSGSGPTDAHKHTVSVICAKQLSTLGIIMNFLDEMSCKVSSEMLCYSFIIFLGHHMVVTRHFLPLSDPFPSISQNCKLVLFGSSIHDYTCVKHRCRISVLPTTGHSPLSASWKISL